MYLNVIGRESNNYDYLITNRKIVRKLRSESSQIELENDGK